jgi:hypothetical protein
MEAGRKRCGATTRAGAPCRRWALPGSEHCRQHSPAPAQRPVESPAGPFDELFSADELQALAARSDEPSVDDVVPVLLVAIRRALADGAQPALVVRACEAYVRALRERGRLGSAGAGEESALRRALDALGAELGAEL